MINSKKTITMNQNKTSEIQIQFLKKIESLLDSSTSLVYELSELLQLSTDSAYRRIRGETVLSLEEIILLCKHFNISFDAFSQEETGMVTFAYKGIESQPENLLDYLNDVYQDLIKISSVPDSQIVYACQDIPVFYHYKHQKIAEFKFFYWMRSIMNAMDLETQKYNPALLHPEIFSVSRKIYELYAKVNSTEIWTDTTISSTIKQIGFYWESGIFNNKDEAIEVCNSLKDEILEIQKQAEICHKISDQNKDIPEESSSYKLYFSEIEITNNCVLIKLSNIKAVYLSHFSFYTMKTRNDIYCNKTEDWLNQLMKKTTLISGVAEKTRYQFFNRALKSIDELVKTIEE